MTPDQIASVQHALNRAATRPTPPAHPQYIKDVAESLAEEGWTPPPPKPTPPPLVTMEESRERFRYAASLPAYQSHVARLGLFLDGWTGHGADEKAINAADNVLVKAVNRRIIEGLGPDVSPRWVYTGPDSGHACYRPDLYRIFCGDTP